MLSLYEVLKSGKIGSARDMFTALWGRQYRNDDKTYELSAALPLTFSSKDGTLENYRIYGSSGGAGDVSHSNNLLPAAAPEVQEQWGLTIESDGQGRFHVYGRAQTGCNFTFYVDDLVLPTSKTKGGNGIWHWCNDTASPKFNVTLYENDLKIATLLGFITMGSQNAIVNNYDWGGRTLTAIVFAFSTMQESIDVHLSPMLTNDDTSAAIPFVPHLQCSLPVTCSDGTNSNTAQIKLLKPLRSSSDGSLRDVADYETQKVTRYVDSSGSPLVTPTQEDITLPAIQTYKGTNTLSTTAVNKPSEVYIKYKK